MNQNIFDFNLLQQKSNLEYRLFEANRSIFNLQNKINMLLEVRSGDDDGLPPRIPRPGRGLPPHSPENSPETGTPPRKPPVRRPGTIPGGVENETPETPKVPSRPTYPWPSPRPTNRNEPARGPWQYQGPGRPIWQNPNSTNFPDFEFPFPMPNGEGTRVIRPIRGGSNNPNNPPGSYEHYYIMGNDGRIWSWAPNETPPQWTLCPAGSSSPYGIIGPDGYLANPPQGWQPDWIWDGGSWYPPIQPTVKPLGPEVPQEIPPTYEFPGIPEGPYQFPGGGQGLGNQHKSNMFENYLMESVMRMLYKKPSFY
jgi:hypothetical protein